MRRPTTNRHSGPKRRRRPTPIPRAPRTAAALASPAASRTWLGTDAQVIRHVRVCGDGHLATATRIELERQGIHRDTDYLLPSLRPALVIACADSDADQSFTNAAQQALEEGSPLLLCCLAGPIVRLGPLIDPSACGAGSPWCQPIPASPSAASTSVASPAEQQSRLAQQPPPPRGRPAKAEVSLNPEARLGAILVSAQALNYLLGARNECVMDRVVELNPWSMESVGYRVFHN